MTEDLKGLIQYATDRQAHYIQAVIDHGSGRKAAEALGVSKSGINNAVRAVRRKADQHKPRTVKPQPPEIEYPHIPNEDVPSDELVRRMTEDYERRKRAWQAKNWMEFRINTELPFCLAFVGDPHIDDSGTDISLLKNHAELIRDTEGMYGVGLGDYTNNWLSFLKTKKSPHESVTQIQAWKLAEWFINTTDWLLLLKGNHDLWSDSHGHGDPLDWICDGEVMAEWQAKFQVTTPALDEPLKIWAAHDFKGNSQWNPNHGPMKAEMMSGSMADIYVAGDKHNWITTKYENATVGKCPVIMRARGYKIMDSYAEQLGFPNQSYGSSTAVVVDPSKEGPSKMQPFECLYEAAEFLEYKRFKHAK